MVVLLGSLQSLRMSMPVPSSDGGWRVQDYTFADSLVLISAIRVRDLTTLVCVVSLACLCSSWSSAGAVSMRPGSSAWFDSNPCATTRLVSIIYRFVTTRATPTAVVPGSLLNDFQKSLENV